MTPPMLHVVLAALLEATAMGTGNSLRPGQRPDLDGKPRRPAGYRLVAGDDRVGIHGLDAAGVLRGIWYLEDLLLLRGGPFRQPDARTRERRYRPRITCSAWGG